MAFHKKYEDAAFLVPDEKDNVFLEAAEKMRDAAYTSKSRKLLKRYVAEILYEGKRHEVWLNRLQIRCRTFITKKKVDIEKSNRALGGYLKAKCLGLK